MQVSLSPASDKIVERMMALGYSDPASLIEVALERLEQEETEAEASPEYRAWISHEVAIGVEAANRGDFYEGSLDDLKAQALTRYQSRQQNAS